MNEKNDKDFHTMNDSVWPEVDSSPVRTVYEQPKKLSMFDRINEAVQLTKATIAVVADHKNTKAAIEWSKQTGTELVNQATDLGNGVLHSDLGKAATKGAAIGAVAAIPIPVIGPIAGAIVGAGIGGYLNLKHGVGGTSPDAVTSDQEMAPTEHGQSTESIISDLKKLDDLRQGGILTDAEFQEQKNKLLKRI